MSHDQPVNVWHLNILSYNSLGSSAGSVHSNTKREACVGNDFNGPISPTEKDGSGYNFTLSDYCTKYVKIVPTADKIASTVAAMVFKLS